jgi:hypothetical protein
MSRADPFPPSEVHAAPNWDLQVLELIRGEQAWEMIQSANQFNDPPSSGMEYILIRVRGISTYEDEEEHSLSDWDFDLTGDRFIQYGSAPVTPPEPELDGNVFTGGEVEGWLVFEVGEEEGNLILIFDELANWDEDRFRYFALEEGNAILVPPELGLVEPTDLGANRSEPAPPSDTVVTEDWEVTVKEVIRGADAWEAIQEANQFNDPPEEGMEYLLAKVKIRYIGTTDEAMRIDKYSFESTGSQNELYDSASVSPPEPVLDVALYPGGEFEGWVPLLAAEEETNLMLVFTPWADFDNQNRRYLSISPRD